VRSLPRGRASVLLVEDEPGLRDVARQVLEKCGYTVVTASSGEDALERCRVRRLEPDLLITDVVMPGMSGSQLVAYLRATRDNLRVLYMSGFTEDAVVHHGVASGEYFLSKPFTPADDQATTLPETSVIVTIVLLNDAVMWAMPLWMFLRTFLAFGLALGLFSGVVVDILVL